MRYDCVTTDATPLTFTERRPPNRPTRLTVSVLSLSNSTETGLDGRPRYPLYPRSTGDDLPGPHDEANVSATPSTPPVRPGGPYPYAPGFKEQGGTSEAAAAKVAGRTSTLRESVLAVLRAWGDMTADETAAFLGESVLSIRPRFTELAARGSIVKTDARRPNFSGHNAAVWTLAPHVTGAA